MEKAFEVRGEEVLDDDYLWVVYYYRRVMSLDKMNIDHSVNSVARTCHPGRSCTGCSHRLIDIGRRDICIVLRLSNVSFLTSNGHPRGRIHLLVVVDPRTVEALHPYLGRMGDRRGASGRYGDQSVRQG